MRLFWKGVWARKRYLLIALTALWKPISAGALWLVENIFGDWAVAAFWNAWNGLPDLPVTLNQVLVWSGDNPVGATSIVALLAMVLIMALAYKETRALKQQATIKITVGSGTARLGQSGLVAKRSADIIVWNSGEPFSLVAHA